MTKQSARDFIEFAETEKNPGERVLESWREAIRWFFRAARGRSATEAAAPIGGIEERCRAVIRARKYSYETEKSYLGWIRRFLGAHRGRAVESLDDDCIREFLSGLARGNCSASTQKQALNSIVFLMREVLGRELGDFSDFERAKVKQRLPVVLSKVEVGRLLDAIPGATGLIARLMYGAGLRLSELLRLRVHPVR